MPANFRGVLILVIFVVDLAVTKFFSTYENECLGYARVHDDGRGRWPTLPSNSKQQ